MPARLRLLKQSQQPLELEERTGLFVEPMTGENDSDQPSKIYTSHSQSVLQGDDNNEFGFWMDEGNTVFNSPKPQVK